MPLEKLEDLFDEHPFLGLPVVEADGHLVGVVSRSAVDEALAGTRGIGQPETTGCLRR